MRNIKRYSRFLMIVTLALMLLVAGCSSGKKDGDVSDKPVKVLLSAGDVGQFNAWKSRSKAFTEESGIEVEFTETPYENLLENITSDGIANGGTYDLVVFLDSMGTSVTQFLEPLDEYMEKDNFNKDRWPSSLLELSTFENKLYSLPVRAHVQMLFYRKDVYDKLNLAVPTTWEEFDIANKKITEEAGMEGVAPYYGAGNNGQNLFMWTAYLWSNYGDIFDENMKPIFNSPEGLEATERYIDLLVKDKVAPSGSVTFGEQESRTYFKQGKAASWLGWWWVYSEFNDTESSAPEVAGNVSFAPVPGWEGKTSSANVSTFPIAMMKGSKNKDAAWEVLKWISSPEEELEIVTQTWNNELPSKETSTVITQVENLKNEELNAVSDDFYAFAAEGFESAKTLPQIKEWPQVADILSSAISNMATGKPVEETLNDAADKVEKLLDEAGYYE